jgi:two-component system, chemotaxis family, protein-glutamate methylesterase/glutaminase
VLQKKYKTEHTLADTAECINILVVDDSAIARGFITRWLEDEDGCRVVATASNGESALTMLRLNRIDVVVLDIEMPGMDGIAALPKILQASPHTQVIMASTLTSRNAEISLRALELGAADYVTKPRSSLSADAGISFRDELIAKVKSLGERASRLRKPIETTLYQRPSDGITASPKAPVISMRKMAAITPKIVAIGSSTGGPQALFSLLAKLNTNLPVPIVITQHMPATFTAILAQHIERLTGFKALEATPNMKIEAGKVYVAPGDRHFEFLAGAPMQASITEDPPVNFCRPAVDPMFRSLVKLHGNAVLGVVLTGMGRDGALGAAEIVAAGGNVFAQDEESSVVWGMPRAVAQAGLSCFIGPLDKMALQINALFGLECRA